jgi:hypothetical protein
MVIAVVAALATVVIPSLIPYDIPLVRNRTRTESGEVLRTIMLFRTDYVEVQVPQEGVPTFDQPWAHLERARSAGFNGGGRTYAPGTALAFWHGTLRGLPFRCAWAWTGDSVAARTDGGWVGELIPILPIWTGLLLNAVFWACAIQYVFPAIRRAGTRWIARARMRRKTCPKCGYDRRGLGEDSPCPECGAAGSSPS